MNIDEIKSTFAEIRELRDEANQKEKQLIQQLQDEGLLPPFSTLLLLGGFGGLWGGDNGKMLEILVMDAINKSKEEK